MRRLIKIARIIKVLLSRIILKTCSTENMKFMIKQAKMNLTTSLTAMGASKSKRHHSKIIIRVEMTMNMSMKERTTMKNIMKNRITSHHITCMSFISLLTELAFNYPKIQAPIAHPSLPSSLKKKFSTKILIEIATGSTIVLK